MFTPNNKYPNMIGRFQHNEDVHLLKLDFEQNPLDGHSDIMVSLSVTPLDIIINKSCLEQIGINIQTHILIMYKENFSQFLQTWCCLYVYLLIDPIILLIK